MDDELLTLARTLAERGWLPGIEIERGDIVRRIFDCETRSATEADIFLATHNGIMEKGWGYDFSRCGWTYVWDDNKFTVQDGTTPLSLLRAYAAAIAASEVKA